MAVRLVARPLERPPIEAVVWRMRKDTRIAEARMRAAPFGRFEIRFFVRDILIYSEVFGDRAALDRLSDEKRAGFIAHGWSVKVTE